MAIAAISTIAIHLNYVFETLKSIDVATISLQ